MFIQIKKVLPAKIKKLGIKKQIKVVGDCSKIEDILNNKIKSNYKIKVLSYKNSDLIIKTNNFHISNELKLIEYHLKREFRDNNIFVKNIRYV